ncbi:hypothetical protein EIM05_26425 [Pseudomonas aeruginosa]|nr:hypothetical protein EGV94_16925 [Pseudomonas aeruginosa]RRJ11897.1 hypothetical protein EIM05_26425 [Pseudomonas aeruginosa]RTB14936.1 hypothetical protein EJ610_30560 [Pseudomonas aeruginosa]
MARIPTHPRMHGYDFPSKRGTAEADACFGGKARRRKPSNAYMHGNAEAELRRSGKTRMRLPGSGEIRSCGFQQKHGSGLNYCHELKITWF